VAARGSERLVNLVIALLVAPRFLSRAEIREVVEGYSRASSEAGFLRMFERDKEDLRRMGIEVMVGPTDLLSDENDGYRIYPEDYYLPEIGLSPQESTIVALASSVWSEPGLATSVSTALTKLRGAGQQVDSQQVSYLTPRVATHEPGFPLLWEALISRTVVELQYRSRTRRVCSWKLIHRSGIWYLLGEDVESGARVFRVSRIEGQPRLVGKPGSYSVPAPELVAELSTHLDPPTASQEVLLAIRNSSAPGLYRRGRVIEDGTAVPAGYQAVAVPYARDDEITSAICAAGPDVLVISPPHIKELVIAQLRAIVELGSARGRGAL